MVVVDPLSAARIRRIFKGDGGAVPLANRNLQGHRHRPVPALLVAAGGKINTATSPQVAAPRQVQQLSFLAVETLDANPRCANIAVVAEIKGQRILVSIATEAGDGLIVLIINSRLIVQRQVAIPAIAP
ncbi:hypothetical protein D3C76_1357900 [compost metagenome]